MSGRFALLALMIVLAIAAYTAGWFTFAHRLESSVAQLISATRASGAEADCTRAQARGYPFRIGLFCDGVAYSDPDSGLSVSGTGLRSASQIYQTSRIVGELDTLSVAVRPAAIVLDLADIRYSTRLASPLPEIASFESRSLTLAAVGSGPLATAGVSRAHMRPNGTDLDVAGSLSSLRLEPSAGAAADLPPIDGEWDVTLRDGIAAATSGAAGIRGKAGEIRTLVARSGAASVALSGPVSVDADGLVDATLTVSITDLPALLALIRTAWPALGAQLGQAEVLLTAMGDNPRLPLAISKGVIRLGFFTLGRISPLD